MAALSNASPVDPVSYTIHGIVDADLVDAATFADIEPTLTRLLTPTDGRQVIVVAHKTAFDIAVLRAKYQRAGLDIPDVPVIDTLDELPAFVGLDRTGRSLEKTCSALDVPHSNLHTAFGDATATAGVFTALLDFCIPAGIATFDELIAALTGATTHTAVADLPSDATSIAAVDVHITAAHRATHNIRFGNDTSDKWMAGAFE